jgi:hypothetical protein
MCVRRNRGHVVRRSEECTNPDLIRPGLATSWKPELDSAFTVSFAKTGSCELGRLSSADAIYGKTGDSRIDETNGRLALPRADPHPPFGVPEPSIQG